MSTSPGTRGVASSAVLSTVGIGLQGVSRLAYTVLIGRFLGTETLGHASTLMSFSILAALLWPTAAGNTASRVFAVALHARRPDVDIIRLLSRSMLISSAVLAVVAFPVALLLGNTPLTAAGASWLVVGYGLYAFARGAQLGYHGAGKTAVWDGVTSVISLGLLLAVCVGGLEGIVLLPLSIGYTVFAVACWPRGNSIADGSPAGKDGLLKFAAWNVLAGITTNGLLQVCMLAAQVVGTDRQAGVYAAAFSLATPASMLGQAVSQVVIPAFAHKDQAASLRQSGPRRLFIGFFVASTVVFGLAILLAPVYLPWFYPTEASEAVPVLRFLLLGVFVFTVALVPAALLLAAGQSKRVAVTSLIGFTIGMIAVLGAAVPSGVEAGSVGFLIGSAVNLIVMIVLSVRGPAAPVEVEPPTAPAT
ncbi:lipopolysaccharide biosynthesis protein [Frigoribacterium sp. CFBP 8751]|uniref:lipopolysaccharide biosynthesis protein n=1 Tax=Frigoribacterium sp. CFBP 8751 TaxID=2775277 RepID=UPI0017856C2E|nr:hypothetical protein [Frigoribacterium sp. CFBP 8751]MBD8538756.1 hypothetical protein [Frigoribacterium sp. CFBP 8751]